MNEHKIDRTGWPAGAWDNEPDRIEWRGPGGMPCLIARNSLGALCGYVALPSAHPWATLDMQSGTPDVECHGGITYGPVRCSADGPICHVALAGEANTVRWIGFDCCHCWDLTPGMYASRGSLRNALPMSGVYRDVAFVRGEVERLAEQAIAAAQS